ncbi:MAG: type Z 30S ribosomal protein S14 [Candidatus Eremiobacteraeota bacterium]|nr:type Z 30S ribosomal protein S14 [Candidatus Eremiobacteraeota bacterium]MBV8643498.1 type Z 30S ribosomal protein S14 [Candidatus Eremiobacteraeota bacterium]MBV9408747.1 type Z 30S ribosomal protein S14 [Candidatus Eremiobacteraeota bacterium]
MAKTSSIEKAKRHQKYSVRVHNRCKVCGRPRAYYRKFGMCRICFRENAHRGFIPGITKASW